MQRTLIATLISTAFLSLGHVAFAQGTLLDGSLSSTSDVEIKIDNPIEYSDRYGGIGASDDQTTDVSLANGSTLMIVTPETIPNDAARIYGIASQPGGTINIESGKTIINLDGADRDTRAIRGNGGDIFLNGGADINLTTESDYLSGIEGWDDSIISLNGKNSKQSEDISISLSANNSEIRGINSNKGAEINLTGKNFYLSCISDKGVVNGVDVESKGKSISLDFDTIKISTQIKEGDDGDENEGVRVAGGGNIKLEGNVTIDVLGENSPNFGVNTQGDKINSANSQIDFLGNQTSIKVIGSGETTGVRPSGPKSLINISSSSVNISTESNNTSSSTGIRVQYGGQANLTNPEADITISSKAPKGVATALLNTTYGLVDAYQYGTINIEASSLSLTAEGATANGITSEVTEGKPIHIADQKDGIFIDAVTNMNVTSTAENGTATAILLSNTKYDPSGLDPAAKVDISNLTAKVTAKNGGNAFGVYAADNGLLTIKDSDITVTSEGGRSIAILNNNSSIVVTGTSTVKAETALEGNGTLDIKKSAVLVLDGKTEQGNWTGTLHVAGKAAIGVSKEDASDLASAPEGTLLLAAGSTVAGAVNVGTTTAATGNSVAIAKDGTVYIKAMQDYDGSSPLVNSDHVNAEPGSSVVLLNAAKVADGTTVFNVTDPESIQDYIFSTDNLLKKVVNNQVVGQTASEVFGGDVLLNNAVVASMATTGLGAERLNALTSSANSPVDAKNAINRIALMGTASGAQTVLLNASEMIGDTLNKHGSKLVGYVHEKQGADLWIDVEGYFSKATRYEAGNTDYGFKSDLAGITVGSDYSFGNGVALGGAVSFGTGSARGQGTGHDTKNDVNYWGFNLYSLWNTPYVNLIGSVGYVQSSNEIKQDGFSAKPKAKAFSVAIRAEKPFDLTPVFTVTPHIGVRYQHVKLDGFSAGGFDYSAENANLFQIPLGVAFNANLKAPCGAVVKPFVDLSFVPNFGDRKVRNTVSLSGSVVTDSFDVRIANNALYNGRIGIEASKGNHSFGLNYGIWAGNKGRVDQSLQAKYRYSF